MAEGPFVVKLLPWLPMLNAATGDLQLARSPLCPLW
jgi:hypothetical protein